MRITFSTEGIAKGSSQRPWLTIGIWLVLLIPALILTATVLVDSLTTEFNPINNPESERANVLLEERLGIADDSRSEVVIVRSEALTVEHPDFESFVTGLFEDVTALGTDLIKGGATYYLTGDEAMVSPDRRTTIIPFAVPRSAEKEIAQVHDVVDEADRSESFEVLITGEASMMADFVEVQEETVRRGESIGISVALVVLVLVFGAVAAALLPIALGIVAVIVAFGATALVAQVLVLPVDTMAMVGMMGLAVGIDYSLFIVSRFREERDRGLDKSDAIAAAGATASRTVLFSGITVVLALLGLTLVPNSVFIGIGIGAILVVFTSVVAALTLLPALLGLLGDKVNALRIPLIQRGATTNPSETTGGFWNWTARTVMRYPVVSLIAAAGLLIAAAIPYVDINLGTSGVASLPDGWRSKDGYNVLQDEFGFGQDLPTMVVIDGETESEGIQNAVQLVEESIRADPAFVPSGLEKYPEARLSVLTAQLSGDPWHNEAMDAVKRLRSDYISEAFEGVDGEATVTGETAIMVDFSQATDSATPYVFAFVLGLSFVLLTLAFRSIVLPVKAIIMNLLSVGAAYGLLVLVFQKGVGADLLGFQQSDTIETWLPLFLFCVLFGLSMDYHLFLLSRIRERYVQTGDNAEAVAFGLRSTGRLITGAALIMVAVFGGFAISDMSMVQQMGFGLGVAVFMDATVVRCILVPSTMRLLDKWNWYMPGWLEWIPRVAIGEGHSSHSPTV